MPLRPPAAPVVAIPPPVAGGGCSDAARHRPHRPCAPSATPATAADSFAKSADRFASIRTRVGQLSLLKGVEGAQRHTRCLHPDSVHTTRRSGVQLAPYRNHQPEYGAHVRTRGSARPQLDQPRRRLTARSAAPGAARYLRASGFAPPAVDRRAFADRCVMAVYAVDRRNGGGASPCRSPKRRANACVSARVVAIARQSASSSTAPHSSVQCATVDRACRV